MNSVRPLPSGARLTPGLTVTDPGVAYWLARVNMIVRRDVSWCWRIRSKHTPERSALPPVVDPAGENLDLVRYDDEKRRFFQTSVAARYLTDALAALERPSVEGELSGSWAWLVRTLRLDDTAEFMLALVLAGRLDSGLGAVFATCINDRSRPFPTLHLAQRLWNDPAKLVACADAAHPLFRTGLLSVADSGSDIGWLAHIDMHASVARQLAWPESELTEGLRLLRQDSSRAFDLGATLLLNRLRSRKPEGMEIVPLVGSPGTPFEDWTAAVGQAVNRPVAFMHPAAAGNPPAVAALAVVAWLRGLDILVPESWSDAIGDKALPQLLSSVQGIPIRWYVPCRSPEALHIAAGASTGPALQIPPLSFDERLQRFTAGLGSAAENLGSAIEECARRFRFQETTIDRIVDGLRTDGQAPDAAALLLACRNETPLNMGGLAQLVSPRFQPAELVLPAKQQRQFTDIINAMRALAEVHYRWGTAKAWNEAGLAVLFSGSPGTGKTMAAEALASTLDLPMYRVDLSQVVNKYIGETEKNLKRIFDAAELSDCILFFDEADALFGKRTDVKDSHDRFANIEISYLLERMERFKGLAILATNRKKDLDEAFMRRLRYAIEFPLPDVRERERIWRQVFPAGVDVSDLDFAFLARQFSLSGGNIRSVAFAACLQSASDRSSRKIKMPVVLLAVKRELEKMNRAAGEGVFGGYGDAIKRLEQ